MPRDNLVAQRIVTPDDASIPGEIVDDAATTQSMAEVIDKHARAATDGQTYAEIGRFLDEDGNPTAEEEEAARNPATRLASALGGGRSAGVDGDEEAVKPRVPGGTSAVRPHAAATLAQMAAPVQVHPVIDRGAAYAWRFLVILAVLIPVGWLIDQLWVVIFPLGIAAVLTVPLSVPARGLRARGLPPAIAAWIVVIGLLGVITLAGFAVVPSLVEEFSDLGPTIEEGVEDLEGWVEDERPFGLDGEQVQDLRENAGDALVEWARSSRGLIVRRAVAALEVLAGVVLSIIVTFFLVKDGQRFQQVVLDLVPAARRSLVRRLAATAWRTLAGYLRGSAMLGVIEGTIVGIAMAVVGARLVVPVVVLTMLAAFVPFAGAIVAGTVAVLVTLVTAGQAEAGIIAIVALVVQQVDNDVLAPWVFGKALSLHPLVVILSIGSGGAILGPIGAVVAVPLVAVALNMLNEARTGEDGAT